jgi:hypothetical protein
MGFIEKEISAAKFEEKWLVRRPMIGWARDVDSRGPANVVWLKKGTLKFCQGPVA